MNDYFSSIKDSILHLSVGNQIKLTQSTAKLENNPGRLGGHMSERYLPKVNANAAALDCLKYYETRNQ
jgi:hypothetical protein